LCFIYISTSFNTRRSDRANRRLWHLHSRSPRLSPSRRLRHLYIHAFASSLTLSAPTALPFSRPRRSDLNLDICRPSSVTVDAYAASILTPTAFAPPLSLSVSTAPPFSRLRPSYLDLNLDSPKQSLGPDESVRQVWSRSAQQFGQQ